jgi:hypothetical protein
MNSMPHSNKDHWFGHDLQNDKRSCLDHPSEHGRFGRFGPSYRKDTHHVGWYLLYSVHTGVYVYVNDLCCYALRHELLTSLHNLASRFAGGLVICAIEAWEPVPCKRCLSPASIALRARRNFLPRIFSAFRFECRAC